MDLYQGVLHFWFKFVFFPAWTDHKLSPGQVRHWQTDSRPTGVHTCKHSNEIPRDQNWLRVKMTTIMPNRRMFTRSISNSVWFHQSNTSEYMYTICCQKRMKQIHYVPTFPHGWYHSVLLGAGCGKYIVTTADLHSMYIYCLLTLNSLTYKFVSKLANIGSENGLSHDRRQVTIWTNAGILLIGPWGTNFNEILIGIHIFSFTKMHLKTSSVKSRSLASASMC